MLTTTPSPPATSTTAPTPAVTLTAEPGATATASPSATPAPSPAPTTATLALGSGWNLITLPVSPTVSLHAQDLLAQALAAGGGSVAELASWTGTGWTTAADARGAGPSGDFPLSLGQGYFLFTDTPITLTVSGVLPTAPPAQTVGNGWNLLGLPWTGTGQTAGDLLAGLAAAGRGPVEVAGWTGSGWQALVRSADGTTAGADFALDQRAGYFVFVQDGGPWPGLLAPPTPVPPS